MGKIILAVKLFWRIWKFVREVQDNAAERLSPDRARQDRLVVEGWLDDQWSLRDVTWRKLIRVDDDLIRYGQAFLKSKNLNDVLNGSSLDCAKARNAMRGVDEARAKFSGPKQP